MPEAAATILPAPPGLAFGAALGMAMAERMLAARFGRSLVDHRTWLFAGAAELAAGTAQEAAYAAGALGLGRLAVFATLPQPEPRLLARFTAIGWTVRTIQATDAAAAEAALSACLRSHKPTLVAEIGEAPASAGPVEDTDADGETAARRGAGARRAWLKRLRRHANREAFQRALAGQFAPGWQKSAHAEAPALPGHRLPSTDATIRAALARLAPVLPDLATLPLRDGQGLPQAASTAFAGRALSWDGLELAAPAALLGMALHGGMLPVAWSPLGMADMALPALRLAAARQLRGLHLLTAGAEAAPYASPPGVPVFQPADPAEAIDCLVLALRRTAGPAILLLAGTAAAVLPPATPRLCARGGYLVHAPPAPDVTLLAAGPELATAAAVHDLLAAAGIQPALVSMPCRAVFDSQDAAYRAGLLGPGRRVAFASADPASFAGLIGPTDISLRAGITPHAAAAAILRHMHRSPPELEE